MSFSYYGELCTEVYDFTKEAGHSINGDVAFYTNKLKQCKGKVLEAMVGSGRMYVPLLEAGIQAEGTDSSAAMLASCTKRCEDRNLSPVLYEMNLQELQLPYQYEAIIIPAGSFLLIENREQSIEALKRLYAHLEPGGKLIMDIFLPDREFKPGAFEGTNSYHMPSGDLITMETKLAEVNLLHQYKVSHLKYEKWRNGELLQTELQYFALRWYGIEEFKLLLESIGFTDVLVYVDFDENKEPAHEEHTFVFEAVRK